jgi:phosphoesterase RecJ-like protein
MMTIMSENTAEKCSQQLTLQETLERIKGAHEIAICGHVNPDGDALGSNLALAALCRALGKNVTSLLAQDQPAPELYQFLPGYDFTSVAHYDKTPDLFVSVDSPNDVRIDEAIQVLKRAKVSLAIDHHPNYESFTTYYYSDPTASATGSIIWQLIIKSGVCISKEMAMYCYVALMTDTGRFAFRNTTQQTFLDASQMIEAGADPAYISRMVYENKQLAAMKLESRLVERVQFAGDGAVVYSFVTEQDMRELGVSRDATEGLPTILRSVRDGKIAALFREEDGGVRINLRSNGSFNVGEFAFLYGGGGHAAAAGISLKTTLTQAMSEIVSKLAAQL